jgi:hypothetical protein
MTAKHQTMETVQIRLPGELIKWIDDFSFAAQAPSHAQWRNPLPDQAWLNAEQAHQRRVARRGAP